MNYFALIQKCCSVILTLVMVFNPTFVSAQTASEYFAKAGEGVSTITNGITTGVSSISENLTLAGSALATEIGDSIIATAEAVKKETTELISKTRNTILAEAESIKTETVTLAVNTKDAIVAGAESIKTETITLAQKTKDTAVAFRNDYIAHAVATADAVTGGAHSLIRGLTRTGDSILSYIASMSTLAATTPQANQQISWLGPQRTHDTPTAFESAAGEGIALLKETTLLDSFARSFSTQLAATTLALPRFSLTADILSPSRNPVFHAFTHATARPVFASNNQPLPEPQPNTLVPARTTATTPANPIREPRASNGAGKLAQASPKADASVGSPTSSSVGAVTLTQSTPSATPQHIASLGTVFEDILALRLQELENKLASRIAALSASTNMQATQTYQVIAQTNKIDRLSSVSISGSTITGSSFAGTSVSATDLSATNATSTSLFATTASSTNLYSTAFTLGTGTLGSSTSTNSYSSTLTAGNATTTSLFSTTASSTNLYSQTAALGSLSVSGAFSQSDLATFTSGFLSNASSTITSGLFSMNGGASTTNFTASGIGYFGTATTTNLFSSSATSTNLFSTTASSTNLYAQAASVGTLAASGAATFSSTLGVTGLGTLAGFLSNASSTITSGLFSMNGGASTTNITASGTGYFGLGQFTNTSGTTTIASGQGFTVGSSQFVVQQGSGNVGINTAVPSYRLQINGNGTDSGAAAMSLNEGGVRQWLLGSGSVTSGNFSIQNMSTGASAFTINGTTNNIGVGTTTPGSQLSVTSGLSVGANYGAAAPSNGAIIEGSVGIGTTTPGSILSVQNVGNFVASATSTLYNGLQVPTFNATGLSTLANTIITNATTTNLFSTTASSTNLFSQAASVGTLAAGGAATLSSTLGVTGLTTLGNLSLTAGTTTNFFSTTASSTNLFSQLATLGTLTLGNALAVTSGGTGVTTSTGTGSVVLSASPTLTGTIAGASQTLSGTLGVTGLTTLGQASTTLFSSYGPAYFGATATSSFSNAGVLTLTGITNSLLAVNASGVVGATTTPTAQYFIATSTSIASTFPYASSTALTASGTGYFGLGAFTNTSGTTTIASGQGFTVGTSQLVVQQGSGNVGLGTTSPSTLLHMVASSPRLRIQATSLVGGELTGIEFNTALNQTHAKIIGNILDDTNNSADGYLQFFTALNGTVGERMRIDNNGNVGIGSTTPYAKLSVKGDGTTTGVNFQTTDSSDVPLLSVVDTGAVTLRSAAISATSFRSLSASPTVTLTAGAGNVSSFGVISSPTINYSGTDILSPTGGSFAVTVNQTTAVASETRALGISGTVNVGASNTQNWQQQEDINAPSGVRGIFQVNAGSAGTIAIGAGVSAQVLGSATGATITKGFGFRLRGITTGTITNAVGAGLYSLSGTNNTYLMLSGTNSSVVTGNYAIYDETGYNSYLSGNVGIGTTTPYSRLSVWGNGTNPIFEAVDNASSTKMVILNSGNVGIGTTNPGAMLDVSHATMNSNNIYISSLNTTGGTHGGLMWRGYYGGTTTFFDAAAIKRVNTDDANTTNNNQRLGFFLHNPVVDGALVERMSILNSGNVGIGTTNPSQKLHVSGKTLLLDTTNELPASSGTTVTGGLRINNTSNIAIDIGSYNVSPYPAWIQVHDSINQATNYPLALNPNGGNVGIGTTTPLSGLQVVSAINGSPTTVGAHLGRVSNFAQLQLFDTAGGIVDFSDAAGEDADFRIIEQSGRLDIGAGTTPTGMTISSTGNVGIGDTTPTEGKLVVADSPSGATVATGLSVTGTSANLGTASYGIIGTGTNSNGSSGIGVKGISPSHVYQHAGTGIGVYGIATLNTDGSNLSTIGVKGEAGVDGGGGGASDTTYAGYFINTSAGGTGFTNHGVWAENNDANDYAIYCNAVNNASGCGGNRAWTNASDERLKENITTIPNALDTVMHLRGVNFTWKQGGQADMGFIAQEVLPYLPQVVNVDSATGYYGMRTGSMTGLLVEAVKDVNSKVDARTSFIENAATSTVLYIDASGNIGIGTSTPQHRLQVQGDVAAESFVNSSTRELKTDITGLATTTEDSILEQLATTNVYSYRYKDEPATNPLRVGLIVDSAPAEVLSVSQDGVDIYKLAVFTLAGVKAQSRQIDALNLNLESIAPLESQEPLTGQATESATFAERFFSNIFARITAWLADAANGIARIVTGTLAAKSVQTDELCVGDVCVTKEQFLKMAQTAGAAGATSDSTGVGGVTSDTTSSATSTADTSSSAEATQDTEAPVITINGLNPATITVGDTYGDLGASVTDNMTQNLGIQASLDGGATTTPEQITIDTSTAGTHTISYSATDQAGNTGTAERIVNVLAPLSIVVADAVATSSPASTDTPVPSSEGGATGQADTVSTDATATSTEAVASSATTTQTTP